MKKGNSTKNIGLQIKSWMIGLLIFLVATIFFLNGKKDQTRQSAYGNRLSEIEINGNKFDIENVSTGEKMALGLGGRDSICEKCGMLFLFGKEGRHGFWMKGMKFNLDIIWIAGDKIVYVAENVPFAGGTQSMISPDSPADKVLELNAGIVGKGGIKAGQTVKFKE